MNVNTYITIRILYETDILKPRKLLSGPLFSKITKIYQIKILTIFKKYMLFKNN